MSRRRHYHPVSHDLHVDPELWKLMNEYGWHVVITWLWILAMCDRTENAFRVDEDDLAQHSRTLHCTSTTLRREVGGLMDKGWLVKAELTLTGWPIVLRTTNYMKYHKAESDWLSRKSGVPHSSEQSDPNKPNNPNRARRVTHVNEHEKRLPERTDPPTQIAKKILENLMPNVAATLEKKNSHQ